MKATQGIMETAIYADDLDAAEAFYRDAFGLELVSKVPDRLVFFKCGQQMLLVFNPQKSRELDPNIVIPRHGAEGAGHFCFFRQGSGRNHRMVRPFRRVGCGYRAASHLTERGAIGLCARPGGQFGRGWRGSVLGL